jgi:hypothetical protein
MRMVGRNQNQVSLETVIPRPPITVRHARSPAAIA